MATAPAEFPEPPCSVFLVGIAGIGMSGLAQLLRWQGYTVAGSDRQEPSGPAAALFRCLRQLGIKTTAQDGSGLRQCRPDIVVASAAVEADNPDLRAAGGRPCFSRAEALAAALARVDTPQIAVAGTCGKTTVTGWTASALRALGHRVLTVCGGVVREFDRAGCYGNFHTDPDPQWAVYEVDESDRSLTVFRPDYGLLLNVGTDHFERAELSRLFGSFARHCRQAVVAADDALAALGSAAPANAVSFATAPPGGSDRVAGLGMASYRCSVEGVRFSVPGLGEFHTRQLGYHSALNALAVVALLRLPGFAVSAADCRAAVAAFEGIRSRFEYIGRSRRGVPVYRDYAHNPEKMAAVLDAAAELGAQRVVALFQPHGYGPLGFMRASLKQALTARLRCGDRFAFLPVYYAGGTTSFQPDSAAVAAEYRNAGLPVLSLPDRILAAEYLEFLSPLPDLALVLGARDPSLDTWARELAVPESSAAG